MKPDLHAMYEELVEWCAILESDEAYQARYKPLEDEFIRILTKHGVEITQADDESVVNYQPHDCGCPEAQQVHDEMHEVFNAHWLEYFKKLVPYKRLVREAQQA